MLDPRLETVLPRPDLSPSDKLVAVALCKFTDRHGVCWPSVRALVALTHLSSRQIQRSLSVLVNVGVIRCEPRFQKRRQTSNLYRFVSEGPGGGSETQEQPVSAPEPADTRPPTDCRPPTGCHEKPTSHRRIGEAETTTDCHPPKNCRGGGCQIVGGEGDRSSPRELSHKELIQKEEGEAHREGPIGAPVLMQIFASRCPGLAVTGKVTKRREEAARQAIRGSPERQSLGWWEEVFDRAARSGFLNGGGSRGWKADYDWIMQEEHLNKLLAGFYDDNSRSRPKGGGESLGDYVARMVKEVGLDGTETVETFDAAD